MLQGGLSLITYVTGWCLTLPMLSCYRVVFDVTYVVMLQGGVWRYLCCHVPGWCLTLPMLSCSRVVFDVTYVVMFQGGVCAREPCDGNRCARAGRTVPIHAALPSILHPSCRARWTLPLPRHHSPQQQPDVWTTHASIYGTGMSHYVTEQVCLIMSQNRYVSFCHRIGTSHSVTEQLRLILSQNRYVSFCHRTGTSHSVTE